MKSYRNYFKTIIALHLFGLVLTGFAGTKPHPPSDRTGHITMLTPAQMEEDIDFLEKTIKDCHFNPYAYISREDFKTAMQKVRQVCRVGDMSIDNFYCQAAWLTGRLKNGHTRISPPMNWYNFNNKKIFPLYFLLDKDKVILQTCQNIDKHYWGLPVSKIGGDPALEVIRHYASFLPREGQDFDPDAILNRSFIWSCLALDYGQKELIIELETAPGKLESMAVLAVDWGEVFGGNQNNSLSSTPSGPIAYNYRSDCRTGIMKVKSFGNHAEFRTAIKDAFADLKANNAQNLIIDLRGCPGGDSSLSDELLCYLTDKEFTCDISAKMKYSKLYEQQRGKLSFTWNGRILSFSIIPIKPGKNPLRFSGSLYVLIDGTTRSTAATFANVVRYYKLGTLIGQETGDTMVSYSDSLSYKLPNSQLTGIVSFKRFEMIGTTKENALKGVEPHYFVRPLPQDILTRRDAVKEFALNLCVPR